MMRALDLSSTATGRPARATAIRHFGSISGGKDSQAVLCKMVERIERIGRAILRTEAALDMVLGAHRFGESNDEETP
ncbi:hypothetical protein CHELA1G11_13725 [Hyphomicrobiales bacterium]|nr:hypothetical protein CHELA1G2_10590 [Hyphomicrobiales bacterium]CAH1673605.1 hypothetical protein CHELA1G11_13725 [Hyphomicrobiales bacterium]